MSKDFIAILKSRNMIHDMSPSLETYISTRSISGYIGFDLTANSLHIGNLASIMLLRHFQLAGHRPIVLVGGATTMVGDPSFKEDERVMVSEEEINYRRECISMQLQKLLRYDQSSTSALLVNNFDWFAKMGVIEFLRDVGKHITVNYMRAKDSVKRRMETGISYTEFTYQLFQGYDFYYLHKNYGVMLQMGGSDQWGNLTTGIELTRRKSGEEVFALTTPLITKADGSKFGKSEKGTNIWLDPNLTSPYEFYQFWLNCSDEDAKKFINVFTVLSKEDIDSLIERHNLAPHERLLQKTLAADVTSYVHSVQECRKAIETSEILFSKDGDLKTLAEKDLLSVFTNIPHISVCKDTVISSSILELLCDFSDGKIFESKSEARRLVKEGGLLINKSKILDIDANMSDFLIYNKYVVVQKGKKNYYLIVCN